MVILVILIVFCAIAFLLLNLLYKSSVAYKNANVAISKFKENIPDNLQFVNFGSTYAMYAFNGYEDLQLNAFNFSIDAQSLEMDDRLMRKYAAHIAPGATVVICLAACVSFFRYSMVNDKVRYYEFLMKDDIPDYSVFKAIRNRFPFSLRALKSMATSFIKGQTEKTIYSDYSSIPPLETMEKNMQEMVDGWIKLFHLKDLKHKDESPINEANKEYNTGVLRSMIEFCLSKGWKPIVVIPPFSYLLNNHFGDDFVSSSLGDMINSAIGDLAINILDYRKHPIFQEDYSSFLDGGFRLNKNGSIKFLKLVLRDLSDTGHQFTNATIAY